MLTQCALYYNNIICIYDTIIIIIRQPNHFQNCFKCKVGDIFPFDTQHPITYSNFSVLEVERASAATKGPSDKLSRYLWHGK